MERTSDVRKRLAQAVSAGLLDHPRPFGYVEGLRSSIPFDRSRDAWLLSFPRSGNTYMRKLLIGSQAGIVTPAVYATEAVEDYRLEDVRGHLVYKTHEDHPLDPDDRVIFLFRHPMDSFVSYMHMAYREGYHEATTADELRPYLVEVLGEWTRLAERALARRPELTLIQSYEELLCTPATILSQVLSFLGVEATVSLEEAVKSASLKNWMAEVQDTHVAQSWGFDSNAANKSIWENLRKNRARVNVWRSVFPRMLQEDFYTHAVRTLWVKLCARAKYRPASRRTEAYICSATGATHAC